MGIRAQWKFEYNVADVLRGVDVKIIHHQERFLFWKEKLKETEVKVKETGVIIHEGVAGGSYQASNANYGPRMMIDSALQQDLNECDGKIKEHRAKLDQYHSWEAVLNSRPDDEKVSLDHEDYHFFFGK